MWEEKESEEREVVRAEREIAISTALANASLRVDSEFNNAR